jgi:phenylalanyl-tRNA synthetase alpha chain
MSASMNERITELLSAGRAGLAAAGTTAAIEEVRIEFLGRKAELPNLLRGVAELPPQERGAAGRAANEARKALEAEIDAKARDLAVVELEARLAADRIDVTLPGDPLPAVGRLHLLTQTRREIEDVFLGLGFNVAEGPEVESVYYNFDALNHDANHPARLASDTFYLDGDYPAAAQEGGLLLRTHTSPMQIRSMLLAPPPIFVIVPGRVYRRDLDATHTPQFHQIEGLAVDEDISLADLKGTLLNFSRAIFGPGREIRLRPHFFPFTEPSVEVDVSCFNCRAGRLADGSRCPLCKGTTWIEILGSGMVDPNVLAHVAANGYDPERYQGFAFGMGIERIAMLKHGVTDLRLFYDNDLRFLEQF